MTLSNVPLKDLLAVIKNNQKCFKDTLNLKPTNPLMSTLPGFAFDELISK